MFYLKTGKSKVNCDCDYTSVCLVCNNITYQNTISVFLEWHIEGFFSSIETSTLLSLMHLDTFSRKHVLSTPFLSNGTGYTSTLPRTVLSINSIPIILKSVNQIKVNLLPRNKHGFLRLSFSQNVYFLDQQLDPLLKRQMALTRSHHHNLIAGCIVKIAFNQYFLLIYHLFNFRFITVLRSLIDGHGTLLDKPTF